MTSEGKTIKEKIPRTDSLTNADLRFHFREGQNELSISLVMQGLA